MSKAMDSKKLCGPECGYARFPSEYALDGAGSCRTFSAIYCTILKKVVLKNSVCRVSAGRRKKDKIR